MRALLRGAAYQVSSHYFNGCVLLQPLTSEYTEGDFVTEYQSISNAIRRHFKVSYFSPELVY